uniref:HPt domain-containing protein n=1 Tax=Pinguiococcus pyrenoidosus TaxID=172671 RepID=A0A7R9YF18_9STRA|mmetsp:Transcript_6396/g.24825  ORF Transcript_6396/g.24825 Transcript_6396/m.24825 type:complete len:222 (+) Transcript_6396:49-714(+)
MKRSSQEITPDDAGAAAAGASAARPEEEGDAAQAAAVGTPEEKTAEETKGVPKDDKEEVEIFCERDALTQTGDDTAFLREMVVESFEEIEERMVELRRIFRDRSDPSPSVASVRGLAHSIKGAAACFAYNRLRNAAKALELHARELESAALNRRPGKRQAVGQEEEPVDFTESHFEVLNPEYLDVEVQLTEAKAELQRRGYEVEKPKQPEKPDVAPSMPEQ